MGAISNLTILRVTEQADMPIRFSHVRKSFSVTGVVRAQARRRRVVRQIDARSVAYLRGQAAGALPG
jgi:hypothetical protein